MEWKAVSEACAGRWHIGLMPEIEFLILIFKDGQY
jgi:hypothetical protein